MKRMSLGLVLSVVVALSAVASANGRAPFTNDVHFRPGDSSSIYVSTTFGLFISHDEGCTFHWICEQNVGYGGSFDPQYAIATDGTIFATTFNGLRVSRDGGCSFTNATADKPADDPRRIADIWIDAIDISPTGVIWVATAESAKPNNVYRSSDNGVSFEPRNMQSSTIWWKSVRVAPSNPQRVYLAGYEVADSPKPHLLRSDNDGAMWTDATLTNVAVASTPIIHVMAIAPDAPDTLFVRSLGVNPPSGDRLYRSTDGGDTFAEVLSATDSITDVVFRDNSNVLATTTGGTVYSSVDGGQTFTVVSGAPKLICVGKREDGKLFGCGPNWDPDYMALARSTDALAWEKVFRFVNMAGPLECAAGTAEHDVCDQELWPSMQQQFATKGPTCGNEVVPGTVDAGTGTSSNKGCCDASGGDFAPIGFATLVTALGLRRRRPTSPKS